MHTYMPHTFVTFERRTGEMTDVNMSEVLFISRGNPNETGIAYGIIFLKNNQTIDVIFRAPPF